MGKARKVDPERDLARAEKALTRAKQTAARLRRRVPRLVVQDWALAGPGGERVALSSLFGPHEELILIHNMGRGCPYCTLWADGFNGVLPHLESRAAFVVTSPDPPEVQGDFAAGRGWRFRMLSTRGTSLAGDLGFERDGRPQPGASVLRRGRDGRIVRVARARFGPGDDYCSVWHLFDLLPRGPGDWKPRFAYERPGPGP